MYTIPMATSRAVFTVGTRYDYANYQQLTLTTLLRVYSHIVSLYVSLYMYLYHVFLYVFCENCGNTDKCVSVQYAYLGWVRNGFYCPYT